MHHQEVSSYIILLLAHIYLDFCLTPKIRKSPPLLMKPRFQKSAPPSPLSSPPAPSSIPPRSFVPARRQTIQKIWERFFFHPFESLKLKCCFANLDWQPTTFAAKFDCFVKYRAPRHSAREHSFSWLEIESCAVIYTCYMKAQQTVCLRAEWPHCTVFHQIIWKMYLLNRESSREPSRL